MKICYLLLFFIFTTKIIVQVGIATTDPKAQLDIRSSNQSTPVNTDGILISKVDAFLAINPTTNFFGTTDDVNLVFKRNNKRAAFIVDGTFDLTTFNHNNGNTSFGDNSLVNPTVNFGAQTGVRNSVFVTIALPKLTSGRRNVAIGDSSLYENTTGNENTAVGFGAMFFNVISSGNTAIGRNALTSFTGSSTSNNGNTRTSNFQMTSSTNSKYILQSDATGNAS